MARNPSLTASYRTRGRSSTSRRVKWLVIMIMVVYMFKKVDLLDDVKVDSIEYVGQLWTGNQILKGGDLRLEEWKFVDACLVAAAGTLLSSQGL